MVPICVLVLLVILAPFNAFTANAAALAISPDGTMVPSQTNEIRGLWRILDEPYIKRTDGAAIVVRAQALDPGMCGYDIIRNLEIPSTIPWNIWIPAYVHKDLYLLVTVSFPYCETDVFYIDNFSHDIEVHSSTPPTEGNMIALIGSNHDPYIAKDFAISGRIQSYSYSVHDPNPQDFTQPVTVTIQSTTYQLVKPSEQDRCKYGASCNYDARQVDQLHGEIFLKRAGIAGGKQWCDTFFLFATTTSTTTTSSSTTSQSTTQQCDVGPQISSVLPAGLNSNDGPWINAEYDNWFRQSEVQQYWDYAGNIMDNPVKYDRVFGHLDTSVDLRNEGQQSVVVDSVIVHMVAKHMRSTYDRSDKNWNYPYEYPIQVGTIIQQGTKVSIPLSSIPLRYAEIGPQFYGPENPNQVYDQQYMVTLEVKYGCIGGPLHSVTTDEFSVYALDNLSSHQWDLVQEVYSLAFGMLNAGTLTEYIVDRLIEWLTDMLYEMTSRIAANQAFVAVIFKETAHTLSLYVYDSSGRVNAQIDGAAFISMSPITGVILPYRAENYRLVVDASAAESPTENFDLRITTIKDGVKVSERTHADTIVSGTQREYGLTVASTGDLDLRVTSGQTPGYDYGILLTLVIAAAVVVSLGFAIANRSRLKTWRNSSSGRLRGTPRFSTSVPQTGGKFCMNCGGRVLRTSSKYCAECGAPVRRR